MEKVKYKRSTISKKKMRSIQRIISFLLILFFVIGAYYIKIKYPEAFERINNFLYTTETVSGTEISFSLEDIPEFDENTPYVVINENIPEFENQYFTKKCFENYSELDALGRCGVAFANVRN